MSILLQPDACKGVRSFELDDYWPIAKPLILKGLGPDFTIEQVYDGIKDGSMQLWMYEDRAALVTIIRTTTEKECLLLACGGNGMSLWLKYLPALEAWAKDQGAIEMVIYGRKGWEKVLNYDIEYCKLVKKLCPEVVQKT